MIAITHLPSPRLDRCELTFVERSAIDHELCLRQHEAYRRLLAECGAEVEVLSENLGCPDCAFVEDAAIVLDEVAVIGRMGVPSRRGETAAIERSLAKHRPVRRIEHPATIEGGDVLRAGRTLLVGRSPRTGAAGIAALRDIAEPLGYRVTAVGVHGCLHLKTACTALDEETLLVNPAWLDATALTGFRAVAVPAEEPWAANVLRLGNHLCLPAAHSRTADLVAARGRRVHTVDLSEFAKAEAGATCLSLLVP